jgi:type II secretory pathway pseudopilin PulG
MGGVMNCSKCRNEITEEIQFCPKCGTPTKPLEETRKKKHSVITLVAMSFGIVGVIVVIMIPIIAIPAAIAIPNFMASKNQTIDSRYLISRVYGEHQALQTALESYYIDYNCYPLPDYDGQGKPIIPHTLTTPIPYIAKLFHDPFKNNGLGYYEYGCDTSTTRRWIVTSYGPDTMDGNSGTPGGKTLDESKAWSNQLLGFPLEHSDLSYDPTNGINSPGDIWRREP